MRKLAVLVSIAALAASAKGNYSLVDDFDGYAVGNANSPGSDAFVQNGGPWTTATGNGATGVTSFVAIADKGAGDRYANFGWTGGWRGMSRTVTTIAQGDVGTYYFRIRTSDTSPNCSFGLSDVASDVPGDYNRFEVQVFLGSDANGITLGAKNGATTTTVVTNLTANTWYDIWVVVDNAADTYDVYFGQTGDRNTLGTLVAEDFGFRNGTADNDLVTFMTLSNNGTPNSQDDNSAFLDKLYYNPVAVSATAALTLGMTQPADLTSGVATNPVLSAVFIDGLETVDPSSISMTVDGAPVAFSYSYNAPTTTVSWAVSPPFAYGSSHTAQVVAASSPGGTLFTKTWSFTVQAAPIDLNFAVLAPDGGWCWYSDPRAVFNNGKLYFGYVQPSTGKSVLDLFDPADGTTTNLWVSDFTESDDHNVPGLCVKQDGAMLAVYNRHTTDPFFAYRVSTGPSPDSPAKWNAEQRIPNSGASMTYANPFQLAGSGEGGKIYNFCRNLNFNPTVYTSTDGGSSWSAPQHFIKTGTGSIRPYVKYCSDGVSRIDINYTDGHPRVVANSLYHMYYENGEFRKTDGTLIKAYANLPIDHDAGERGSVIYQYSDAAQADPNEWIPTGRAWCWEVANEAGGNPVCVFTVQRDMVAGTTEMDDRMYYYYARWTGTGWQKRFIAHAGSPLYAGQDDYAGGICIDPQNPSVIYLSSNMVDPFDLSMGNTTVKSDGKFEIWKGVTSDGGLTFQWTAITSNSTHSNLRPYVPRRNGGEECVIWYRGTYTSYTSFNTDIVGLFSSAVPAQLVSTTPTGTNASTLPVIQAVISGYGSVSPGAVHLFLNGTEVSQPTVTEADGLMTVSYTVLNGLSSVTEYTVRLIVDGTSISKEWSFTTGEGPITYVDAVAGANTYATGGSLADQSWRVTKNNFNADESHWDTRTLGNGGITYQALADVSTGGIPELTTEITGLTSGKQYSIYVFFGRNISQSWNISAGLSSGSLSDYAGSSALLASNLAYLPGKAPTVFTPSAGIDLVAAKVGTATADGNGVVKVHVDHNTGLTGGNRTWYEGVGYVEAVDFVIRSFTLAGGTARISWTAQIGATYDIVHKAKLTDAVWTPVETGIVGADGIISRSVDVGSADSGFFRIEKH